MKKEYYTSLRNNNGKSQSWVLLKENGVVETMSASKSYSGTDGATGTMEPNPTNFMSIINDIDAVAKEYPEIYEEVFYHILDSDQRDYGYVEVAIHCGEKANCKKKLIEEIVEAEQHMESLTDSASNSSTNDGNNYFPSPSSFRFGLPIIDEEVESSDKNNLDFEMRCHYFKDTLERKGIFEVKSWVFPIYCSYYCDKNREKWHVIEPMREEDSSDNGIIEPVALPIYDEEALEDYLNKIIQRCDSFYTRHELNKRIDEVVKQYRNRCNKLKEKLQKLGVSRNIERRAYFDKNGRQFEVIGPRVDDPEDPGSFRVIEKDVKQQEKQDDGWDR